MRIYELTKKENKRNGQSKAVTDLLKKHKALTTAEILKALKRFPEANIRWHLSQLHVAGFIKSTDVKAKDPVFVGKRKVVKLVVGDLTPQQVKNFKKASKEAL
ncbi:MAG TPA: hypothetical protein VNY29_12095 [Terriglobales bacterium]|jgi:hypothetical protein|nr:hypothetical protein [Terriglobales bacterium]